MSSTNINQCVNSNSKYYLYNLEADVPELLDLGPDEAGHLQYSTVYCSTVQYSTNPCEDAVLHGRGEAAPLGGVGVQVPAHDVLYPLRGQDQQN